jgi:hypothetical protein
MSTYTIAAGNHFADGTNFGFHSSGKTVFKTAIFSPSCIYDLGNSNQADINKLYGFSVGLFSGNDYNSARFGWRWSIPKEKIELLAYVYVNGVRINEWDADTLLASVDVNAETYTEIAVLGSQYSFKTISNGITVIKSLPRAGSGTGYNQFPYFGGDEVAPHTMTIELN